MNLLSPERIFDEVVPEPQSWRTLLSFYENSVQQWSFGLTLFALIATAICAITFSVTKNQVFATSAMIALIAFYLLFFIYQIALVVPEFKKMLEPERTILKPIIEKFAADLKRVEYLAAHFDAIHIQFAQQRLSLIGNHLRQRIALIVGSIEKVGIFPLGITAYFTLKKFEADKLPVDFSAVEWVGIALGVFYFSALLLYQKSQEFERHELIFKMALDLKQQQAESKKQ